MGVIDGQSVSAAVTNPAFINKNADDATPSKLGLMNNDPASGASIINLQRALNTLFSSSGTTELVPGTTYNGPSGTINNGDSYQVALSKLAALFSGSAGHVHNGVDGQGAKVSAINIANVPLRGYINQGVDLVLVSGTSTNVSALLAGKSASTDSTTPGVVVVAPYNRVMIRQSGNVAADDQIVDAYGNAIYGRLTKSGAVWTLTFYSELNGTETVYNITSAMNIRWYYQELFNPLAGAPTYDPGLIVPSDNATADVVVATTGIQGKVSLANTGNLPGAIGPARLPGTPTGIVANFDHTHEGVHSLGIYGDITANPMGDVQLEPGQNIFITKNAGRIRISTNGSVGYQEYPIGTVDGTNATFGPLNYFPSNTSSVFVYIDSKIIPFDGWTLSGNSITFGAGYIPQPGQSVYVAYLTAGTPLGAQKIEYRTLTALEASNKQLTLSYSPSNPLNVMVDLIGGGAQQYGVDYAVTTNVLSWAGLGLDGVLLASHVARIHYLT